MQRRDVDDHRRELAARDRESAFATMHAPPRFIASTHWRGSSGARWTVLSHSLSPVVDAHLHLRDRLVEQRHGGRAFTNAEIEASQSSGGRFGTTGVRLMSTSTISSVPFTTPSKPHSRDASSLRALEVELLDHLGGAGERHHAPAVDLAAEPGRSRRG